MAQTTKTGGPLPLRTWQPRMTDTNPKDQPAWPILLGAAIVIAMLFFGVGYAHALEDQTSLIKTSCEINTFSQMRHEDNHQHIYPPLWLNKRYVKRRVNMCVHRFKEENKDLL